MKKKKNLGSFPRHTIQIQDYVPTTNAKEAEINWFYEDIQDILEWTPEKEMPLSS